MGILSIRNGWCESSHQVRGGTEAIMGKTGLSSRISMKDNMRLKQLFPYLLMNFFVLLILLTFLVSAHELLSRTFSVENEITLSY